jgi:hypothetical protein
MVIQPLVDGHSTDYTDDASNNLTNGYSRPLPQRITPNGPSARAQIPPRITIPTNPGEDTNKEATSWSRDQSVTKLPSAAPPMHHHPHQPGEDIVCYPLFRHRYLPSVRKALSFLPRVTHPHQSVAKKRTSAFYRELTRKGSQRNGKGDPTCEMCPSLRDGGGSGHPLEQAIAEMSNISKPATENCHAQAAAVEFQATSL